MNWPNDLLLSRPVAKATSKCTQHKTTIPWKHSTAAASALALLISNSTAHVWKYCHRSCYHSRIREQFGEEGKCLTTECVRVWYYNPQHTLQDLNTNKNGRPAEYRWRPLFNAAKFGWRPLLECRTVTLPRRESRWNWKGCPKLANRSQPLLARSSPYYEDMWRSYRCLTCFFPIVDICLSCEDTARQSCAMVSKWRFFCILYFQRAASSTFQTCILNLH